MDRPESRRPDGTFRGRDGGRPDGIPREDLDCKGAWVHYAGVAEFPGADYEQGLMCRPG